MGIQTRVLAAALASAASVLAHGHVSYVVVNGVKYQGYESDQYPHISNPPVVAGWTINAPDNGFVSPDKFGGPDIICHIDGKPGGAHITVAAGDTIALAWNTWPDSHKGPVLDYLAKCDGNCETVDKTSLRFFKIDGPGHISGANPGTYAADVLIQNAFTWKVQIPPSVAPGNYVLRHEIIALHSGNQANGAQAYPQCFNLRITGSGTAQPAGVAGTALYKATDPGILYNLYSSPANYIVPGPTVIAGAPISVAQGTSAITATGTATRPGGDGGSNPPAQTTSGNNNPPASQTVQPTQPTQPPATTQLPSPGQVQTKYGQCGGSGWTGPTACAPGSSCNVANQWYSQCL